MTLSLVSQLLPSGGAIYYTAAYRNLIESHLQWLRAQTDSTPLAVDPQVAYKYEGDLYGALTQLNVPRYLHWTIMRVNGLYNPSDFNGEAVALVVPSTATLNQLVALAQTTQKQIT